MDDYRLRETKQYVTAGSQMEFGSTLQPLQIIFTENTFRDYCRQTQNVWTLTKSVMLLKWSCCCMHDIVYIECICCPTTTICKFKHVLCSIFSAWGNLWACFLFLYILKSLNKSYLFNTSVLSISCLQNNHKPSLDECVTLLLKATDRQTHEKPDITRRLWKLSVGNERGKMMLMHCNLLLTVNDFQKIDSRLSLDLQCAHRNFYLCCTLKFSLIPCIYLCQIQKCFK